MEVLDPALEVGVEVPPVNVLHRSSVEWSHCADSSLNKLMGGKLDIRKCEDPRVQLQSARQIEENVQGGRVTTPLPAGSHL